MATKATEFGEIMQNNAITPFKVTDFGTNRKPICDFLLIVTYLLSCTISKLWPIIGQIFTSNRRVLHF